MSKILMDSKDLRALLEVARRNGTEDAWPACALQWIEAAEQEIARRGDALARAEAAEARAAAAEAALERLRSAATLALAELEAYADGPEDTWSVAAEGVRAALADAPGEGEEKP